MFMSSGFLWVDYEPNNIDCLREFVYIDAHSAKFVDQITGIYHA